MKTSKLRDVLPPKVEIKKSGNRLEILGNEELTKENHAFTFISVYGFEKLNGTGFFKNTDDFEETLRIVREYLTEQNFEFFGDEFCQEILDRLNNRERDFQGAKECGEGIKTNEPVNLEIPNFSIKRKLLPYQIRPVQHMIQVSNVANFSIPGSGKTTMAYAAYAILKSNSNVDQLFVVGPLSSFTPWEEEFTNCFDIPYENHVLRYVGSPSEREKLSSQFHDFEVILTNIPIVNNDFETLKANLFSGRKIMLVLDESHHIKSFAENATFANTMIGIGRFAKKRVILTGTPMPHNWPDLWSQITFLYPDGRVLGPRIAYRSMMERIHASTQISNEINFLWTRVTHKQMKDDLPKMNIIPELVPMSPLQNEIYRALAFQLK